jgi:hypothetical protein
MTFYQFSGFGRNISMKHNSIHPFDRSYPYYNLQLYLLQCVVDGLLSSMVSCPPDPTYLIATCTFVITISTFAIFFDSWFLLFIFGITILSSVNPGFLHTSFWSIQHMIIIILSRVDRWIWYDETNNTNLGKRITSNWHRILHPNSL